MRHSNEMTIKEAIDLMLKTFHIKEKAAAEKVKAEWQDIAGEYIAARTTKVFVKEKTLFIQIESAVLKNEMHFMANRIIRTVNEKVGFTLVDKLAVL